MIASNIHQTASTRSSVIVWAALVVLLGVSIGLGRTPNVYLMNALVFSVAIVKALTVLIKFMHVRLEPKVMALILLSAVALIVVLVLGAAPDVTNKYRIPETPVSL